MGTNYYAEWLLGVQGGGPVEVLGSSMTLNLHVCKSLRMFQGAIFNSWQAWKHFLTVNSDRIVIRSEYGDTMELEEFIEQVEMTPYPLRRRQTDWVLAHAGDPDRDWLDADRFSFHNGEFF